MNKPYPERLLMVPGPVDAGVQARNALSLPVIYHRTTEFEKLFHTVSLKLQKVFLTGNPVLIIHGSGTAAMEASMINFIEPQNEILILQNGIFSRRFCEIAATHNIKKDILKFPNGYSLDPDTIKKTLLKKGKRYKAVFLTHVETSTGAINDIYQISKLIKKYTPALIVVDAMASVAAEKLLTDDWGIDIAITSSCKAIGSVAGLSFVSVSKKASKRLHNARPDSFYLSLRIVYDYHKRNQTPFTGSSSMLNATNAALDKILKKGLRNIWQQTAELALQARNFCQKNGFEIFPKTPANALTAIKMKNSGYIVKMMQKRFNIVVADGQSELKGKLIRISNMCNVVGRDINRTFTALKNLVREIK